MRISLEANGEVFAKQLAGLRRDLNRLSAQGGQVGLSARMSLPVFLPFLTVLRTELRDDVVPGEVMRGVTDLLANIAKTAVQSLAEAPALIEGEMVEQVLTEAIHTACRSIAQEAEAKKPKLAVVPKGPAKLSVVHNQTEDGGAE